jgi:phage gp16-like protein
MFDDFRSRSNTSAPTFSQLCSEVHHEQKSLVGHMHKKMAGELKQLRPAAELFRVQALSLTGAKEWLTAMSMTSAFHRTS